MALFFAVVIGFTLLQVSTTYAQTPQSSASSQVADPAITATGAIGEVKAIDAASKQMTVKTDAGSLVTVSLSDKTVYMRLAPGEQKLTNAEKITLTDVGEGDRVWARGRVSEDHKSVPAAAVVVMTKADIAKKQEAERNEWRKRGVSGIVKSVNPSTREITVSSRSLAGQSQSVIIPVTDKVLLRRYPPDTVPKYSDAKPSKFEEVKVNDQLRALGDKSADGTHLTAEEVVFGTFKIAGGTVTAIDAANNQIKINDLTTKKSLTIVFKPDSIIRRLPQGAAMMLGGGMGPGGPGGGQGAGQGRPQAQGQGQRPEGAGPGGPQGGGMRMGGGSMADMLEKLPVISINDLKVGDTILMSSLPGADPTQLTAIQLVTGAETLLAMAAARPQQGGQGRPQGGVDLNGSFGGMFGGLGGP